MSSRHYNPDDKETLKVLKMQQEKLERLKGKTADLHERQAAMGDRLAELRRMAAGMAADEEVDLPEEHHYPTPTSRPDREKMKLSEVPSWESLAHHSEHAVSGDTSVEDLLTDDEIRESAERVKQINDEFQRRTGLNQRDMAFLTVATAIQSTRWMMMPQLVGTMGRVARVLTALAPSTMALLERRPKSPQDVALIDDVNQQFQQEAGWDAADEVKEGYKSWEDILEDRTAAASAAPEHAFDNDALNWLFGIINNITGTRTAGDFSTVDAVTGEAVKTAGIFADAFRSIKEDWLRLPAAVYAQYAQDKAAQGETVDLLQPLADSFSPEMLSDLYTSQFTQLTALEDLTLVGQQAAVPLIINMAVGLLHGFMYNPAKDGPRPYYDARTRKILLYSNALASASNLAIAAGSENWAKLDVGGLIVTTIRIAQDSSYIINLKDQFIRTEMDKVLEQELQDIDSHFLNLPSTTRE